MSLPDHFRMLARYNKLANLRLLEVCARLTEDDLRKAGPSSFGSIHGLLNHILPGDRIWLSRFEGSGHTTPALNTILYDDFTLFSAARIEQDDRIVAFFEQATDEHLTRSLRYVNSLGKPCVDEAGMAIAHFFNHQTHHRGQIHTLLSQSNTQPPSLDLHRIINP